MCNRDDNMTGWEPKSWSDPVDNFLMTNAYPTLLNRHGSCVPSQECIQDAITRYLEQNEHRTG